MAMGVDDTLMAYDECLPARHFEFGSDGIAAHVIPCSAHDRWPSHQHRTAGVALLCGVAVPTVQQAEAALSDQWVPTWLWPHIGMALYSYGA